MKIRFRLYPKEAESLGMSVKNPVEGRKQAQYYVTQEEKSRILAERENNVSVKTTTKPNDYKQKTFVLSAWNNEGYMMDIDQYCTHYSLPREDISSYKLVSHTGTPFYNIVFKENIEDNVQEIDIEGIVKKHIKPAPILPKVVKTQHLFDRLVYTDVHIGMNPNENGFSLYGGQWNEQELQKTLEHIVLHVLANKQSNTLVVDELGDFMDGWDGETVRKGHKLPQNMDNEKAFDIGLSFKVKMIDSLAPYYEKIICHNICNDNHAGSFGYVVNSAFKSICEIKYSNVEVINYRSFINHYFIGDYCFILTHGKDGKHLKFGFTPILDAKQEKKISNYIDENYLMKKNGSIEFSKGDSHQDIFDSSTSDKFDYYNYPALSPSSEWVQTNFQKGKRGFYFFNYSNNDKTIHPKYL